MDQPTATAPTSAAIVPRAMSNLRLRLTRGHIVVAASSLFLLPNALMAPGLKLLPGLLVLVGCLGALLTIVNEVRSCRTGFLAERVDPAIIALCSLAALVLCVLGGQGHFVFANYDWLTRDAVLADLVRRGFPAFYDHHGSEFLLRAPIGMYMLPAAVGRGLGLHAAHLALLAQNTAILALILSLLASMAPGRKPVFLAVFATFSGVEILGNLLKWGLSPQIATHAWPLHAHQHLTAWNPFFQYTNHVAQIFWVPNHAFPGWWLAALSILHVRREIRSEVLVVAFAWSLLWSPLTMAGALPIVGYLVLRHDGRELLRPRLMIGCGAALCFLPIVAYLAADGGSVPHFWPFLYDGFWSLYVLFILIQIPQAAVVASYWRRLDPPSRTLSMLAIGVLLAIPFYRLGANNDFAMRASIMPLALLAFVFASIVAQLRLSDGGRQVAAVVVILVLGCLTPALEIQRALMLKPFAISDCNLLTTWSLLEPDHWFANYLARSDRTPAWLVRRDGAAPAMTIEDRSCWPDHPFENLPMTAWGDAENW
jgi:hypothetical protein